MENQRHGRSGLSRMLGIMPISIHKIQTKTDPADRHYTEHTAVFIFKNTLSKQRVTREGVGFPLENPVKPHKNSRVLTR